MNTGMNGRMNAEVHVLTGAYVLDALSDDERADFERHLTECETCTQEVAELGETATRLGQAATAEPPPDLRATVLARIARVRQLPPEGAASTLRPRRPAASRLALRLSAAAAAVLLVIAATLGVLLVREQQATEDARYQAEAITSILRADDAQVATRSDPSGGRMTIVVSHSANRMLLLTDRLPPPPSGHDYQAWAIGTQTRSAGLIHPENGRATLPVHGINTADQIGITIEPAGGSDQPTTDPIMLITLP